MAYTTSTLLGYMETVLGAPGGVASALGLLETDALTEAVNEVAAILGAAIPDLTDDLKTRTVARWQAWLTAKGAASGQFDVSLTGGKKFTRSQMWDHINAMLRDAELAASRYPDVAVIIGSGLPDPIPFGGGLSIADKASREDDVDRVLPYFTREMHEATS